MDKPKANDIMTDFIPHESLATPSPEKRLVVSGGSEPANYIEDAFQIRNLVRVLTPDVIDANGTIQVIIRDGHEANISPSVLYDGLLAMQRIAFEKAEAFGLEFDRDTYNNEE